MEDLFEMKMSRRQIDAISNLGLAHIGDGVYELMCRAYLCAHGGHTVKNLHRDAVNMVKAPTQARLIEGVLPLLTEQELAYFRRGKNAHSHAAPKSATPQEYARATGLETLFGALYLGGEKARLNELFEKMMEIYHGL